MVRATTILIWVTWLAMILGCLAENIGVNWGMMTSHPMLPTTVVDMIKANGIKKVKLFDADSWTLGALAGSGIEVMVGIPNDMLKQMNDYDNAKDWVKANVTKYNFNGGVKIKRDFCTDSCSNWYDQVNCPTMPDVANDSQLVHLCNGTRRNATETLLRWTPSRLYRSVDVSSFERIK